ncbi:M48 family metallopeptidase [Thalassotalea mangrovi]|uniref:Heat-shock protein HtpX n=1 Tax=Thalassotalea mangrovi TaxID=2572245 RepID=A0A4U1B448_9GAMM|nr:M48 family metallopeptidase [Thalassotalea mangrovi]TKB44829.1 heat-shock protein HtpX [Thalassotalea mangrovi]
MDFFKAQDQAKRSTSLLVLLFFAAVITLVVITNALAMVALGYVNLDSDTSLDLAYFSSQFDWRVFAFISAVVGFVIFSGSAYKQISLRAGGKAIAESLGGTLINANSANILEKRLINVVEEMAIAAGTPVPRVYVLKDEAGINAFAAGFTTSDAVIGITQGALEKLERDQLQGVIAHEFSHILNGDMRLNLQLVALLHGILVIGFIGYYLLRAGRGNNKNGAAILALGFGLMLIGYGGHFFGNIIKASISRQREYLADASAVQFTRNKEGISEALYKIKQSAYGSYIEQPDAIEYTHGFFSTGVKSFSARLFATHPPLDERITRISPHLLLNKANADHKPMRKVNKVKGESVTASANVSGSNMKSAVVESITALSVLSQAGNITDQQLDYAHQLVSSFNDQIYSASHDPCGAMAIVCCLLLSDQAQVLNDQLEFIQNADELQIIDHVFALRQDITELALGLRLPLIDMANPALKQLSNIQVTRFEQLVKALIFADEKLDRFEWVLQQVVFRHIENRQPSRIGKKYLPIAKVEQSAHTLYSLVLGATEHQLTDQHLEALRFSSELMQLRPLNPELTDFTQASACLDELNQLGFGDKEKIIRGCLFLIGIDGIFSIKEYELVRAIADVLGVPLPPDFRIGPTH